MSKLLFEALGQVDEKILTESTKTMIKEAFDKAVDENVGKKLEAQLKSITEATEDFSKKILEAHVADLKESFDKAVEAKTNEKVEEYSEYVKESVAKQHAEDLKQINESLEKYVKYAVEKFVDENKATWQDEVHVTRANAIMESASKFANDFGIELHGLTNEDEARKMLDESIGELERIKAENASMKREKLIAESCKDMSLSQVAKIETLMEDFSVEDEEVFKKRIDLFKETLVESVVVKPEQKPESNKPSWAN